MKNLEIIISKTSSGSKHQKERYLPKNILRNSVLNIKSTTFQQTMKNLFEFMSFVTIKVLEFNHNLSFWASSQLLLSFIKV